MNTSIPIKKDEDVLIVSAKIDLAIKEYQNFKMYICQPNRTFRDVDYLAFYNANRVLKEVPKILGIIEDFNLLTGKIKSADIQKVSSNYDKNILLQRIKKVQKTWKRYGNNKILILSENIEQGTVKLKKEIINNKTAKSGRRVAYAQGHVYTSLSKLKNATYTSHL